MYSIEEKKKYFSVPTESVMGTPEDKWGYMYKRLDNFLAVINITIKGIKPGRTVDIGMTSDLHFNYLNTQDFEEKNPAVISSSKNRVWLRGGESIGNAIRALEFCAHTDQTVVCGDILDYFTHGAMEYAQKYLFNAYPEALACIGGHELTCCMQGEIEDTLPVECKKKALSEIWNNDIEYCSRLIADRVLVVVMNNDCGVYTAEQCQKMENDIQRARDNGYTVLIFQHEPISTGNPEDVDVDFLRVGDPNVPHDFFNDLAGNADCGEDTERMYKCITSAADVVKGIFCGHWHNDIYTEVLASERTDDSSEKKTVIPQYIITSNAYENGTVMHINIV